MTQQTPHDQLARDRIRVDLNTNMLVEAGAGSGKTTALVDRMLEHVRIGTSVERIAAVTFTRKAASELRERFQVRLEREVREAGVASEAGMRCERALRELDRAFLGTIHSFCARLLRERPLEVGLDPKFQEVSEDGWEELKQRFWRRWVECARRDDDAGLAALYAVGIDPSMLFDSFERVMTYPDVHFPLVASAQPDTAGCRREIERLLAAARKAMPTAEPSDGWDDLMRLVRRLEFKRSLGQFDDIVGFCDALDGIAAKHCEVVQKRWSDSREGKKAAKALSDDWVALLEGPIADVLRCWREHRYPIVMNVLQRAAADFARERHATGQLGFEDLLLLSARLLRQNPAVRNELGARYAHLLVDEFQDTDPIQAEVCFLLTSGSSEGNDWRTVTPRPGSLFVVGDPKQSIYRFRRADIQIYDLVKKRMEAFGVVLPLTANFRSVSSVEAVVNAHFAIVFPVEATAEQAPYSPMETQREPEGKDGVYRYVVRPVGKKKEEVLELDSAMVASWIAERIAKGEKTAGDFMILTATKEPIESYARALSERNVPVTTTGARLPQEHELRELLVVLRAIADPDDAVRVVAALEGLFFGLSPADLWEASRRGVRFAMTHPPMDSADATARALAQLHEWWKSSQRHPADVLLERVLDESGLLLYAAAEALGEARAGALLHLVESLRGASVGGGNGLPDAMERLESILGAEAADAPLRPGRTDAVRVMNLHKAKGLEADVVVLGAPIDRTEFEPSVHVSRGESGKATGALCIGYKEGGSHRVLAHPPRWAELQAVEMRFEEAERARVLYVAATRAKRELMVSQCEKTYVGGAKPDSAIWRPLAPTLEEYTVLRALPVTEAPGRKKVERTAGSLQKETAEAIERVRAAGVSSIRFVSVTEEVKGGDDDVPIFAGGSVARAVSGVAWGRAVHRSIEALGRGRTGDSLRAFVLAVGADEGLDAGVADGLVALVERLAQSDTWKGLAASGALRVELPVMHRTEIDGIETITEGVIDAAALGPEGWRIVDWKTDDVDDAGWAGRRQRYARQVNAYAKLLSELSGMAATGTLERLSAS
jgi:ATP-dependent helicase/nuclease subunit A